MQRFAETVRRKRYCCTTAAGVWCGKRSRLGNAKSKKLEGGRRGEEGARGGELKQEKRRRHKSKRLREMSREVITIVDDEHPQLQEEKEQQPHQQQFEQQDIPCVACTFRNRTGAAVCSMCETPLVDEIQPRESSGREQMDQHAYLRLGGERWPNNADHGGDDLLGGGSGGGSTLVPTSVDLKARTIAAQEDRQAATHGLMKRIHGKLLNEYYSSRSDGTINEDEVGGAAISAGSVEARERQTIIRPEGGLERRRPANGSQQDGGAGMGKTWGAEWRLCDPRTVHFTQKRQRGSRFSCGYRNIQMLCSALMEWPEYKRVLFGGSGCIPGISLLQCWIERAWADGYDPQGCEQLGGPGALMGSETWIGATECAALLRSFGVKAEVFDFELTAPPAQAAVACSENAGKTAQLAGRCDVGAGGGRNSIKRKAPDSMSSSRSSFSPRPSCFQTNGNGSRSMGLHQQQQSIRSFLQPSIQGDRRALATQPTIKRSRTSGSWKPEGTEMTSVQGRRRCGEEQLLGTGAADVKGSDRSDDVADGREKYEEKRGSCEWSSSGTGGSGGRVRPPSGRRGGHSGKYAPRGSVGKDVGDRMGQALLEWIWGYFCTPWGTTEEGDDSPSFESCAYSAGRLEPPQRSAPSQVRKCHHPEPFEAVVSQVDGQPFPPVETTGRDSSAPTLPTGVSVSSSSAGDGATAAATATLQQQLRTTKDARDAAFLDGESSEAVGPGKSIAVAADTQARKARPPPPLYFQHDGHSRSVVGVLWPGRKTAAATSNQHGESWLMEGGRSSSHGRRGDRGGPGRHGARGKRQPGSLLVFDPSHVGTEIRDALDKTPKQGWGRFLKRGEHTLHRRQFQVVAVRPGLVKPRQAHAWKTIVSEKIFVD